MRALDGVGQRPRVGRRGVRRFPLVHALGAAFVDHALGVAEDDVLVAEAQRLDQLQAGDAGRARAVADELRVLDRHARDVKRVQDAGRNDDGGAVLIVMEHRDVHDLAQPLLDHEAFRGLDVLQIDAAERRAEQAHAVDEFVHVLGRDLQVEGVDVGEALEQHRLALHHGLGRERPQIAEPEDGGPVRDDGDHVALGRVVEGLVGVCGDREHRYGDARRIGQRQVALGRHRLGRGDL
jgi:hypothetical protein